MMVGIDCSVFRDIATEKEFAIKLYEEQNAFVIPSSCFFAEGFIRIVICTSIPIMDEFGVRVTEFCNQHYL